MTRTRLRAYSACMAIQIREVAADDLVALMPVWEEIKTENPALDVELLISRIDMSRKSETFRMIVAWEGPRAVGVGFVSLVDAGTWSESPSVQVSGMHVLHRARHRGVAKAILNAAMLYADRWGCGNLVAAVPPAEREANRFFARLGFAPISTRRATDVASLRKKISADSSRVVAARLRRRPVDGSSSIAS